MIERAGEMERIGLLREYYGRVVRECEKSGELKRVKRLSKRWLSGVRDHWKWREWSTRKSEQSKACGTAVCLSVIGRHDPLIAFDETKRGKSLNEENHFRFRKAQRFSCFSLF